MARSADLTCFKSYDIRGELNKNFDVKICYKIARAFASFQRAERVVVGRDARESSPVLLDSICDGLMKQGVEVLDIGLAGTEEMYWATTEYNASGGIEVTASHNPINFNGIKLVKYGSKPISESELLAIKKIVEHDLFDESQANGSRVNIATEARQKYVRKVLSFVNGSKFRALKVVVNSGNGAAGPTFDAVASALFKVNSKVSFERMHHVVDSSFPNGIPNPILKEMHLQNSIKICETKADLGIAFDGDFDRCFFFDEQGDFVPGEYIVGLLATIFLEKEAGATIVHDPRAVWNIRDIVAGNGGTSKLSLTGHAFVKRTMRDSKAVYGGEMSAHHYFRDFSYCDSGMIPWLLILQFMSDNQKTLSELVSEQRIKFPSSGEINFQIKNIDESIKKVTRFYEKKCKLKEEFDGLSFSFDNWRFNLRRSNTEPLVRLNVESRGDSALVNQKVKEIENLLYS